MYVREAGPGGTAETVLLLHGTPSPAEDWRPLVDALLPRYRVLVPDLPGYGQSAALASPSIENVGDALVSMLAERDVDRLHAIVGFSTGAYRALDLVVRRNVLPKVVIAVAGMATFDDEARALRFEFAARLQADPGWLHSKELREVMCQLMLSPSWRASHPDDEGRVAGWTRITTAEALVGELRALATASDLRPALAQVGVPVYARVGAVDIGAPPAWSRDIVQSVVQGELEIVPGCGHALLIEDRERTCGAIRLRIEGAERDYVR